MAAVAGAKVTFTYSVTWVETDIAYEDRFNRCVCASVLYVRVR